jgi:hypothetical protein
MAKIDEKRVELFYEKLTGKKPERGNWNVERRNFAQKIVYIEQACNSVLAAIRDLEQASPDADVRELERTLLTEFKFLDTLQARPPVEHNPASIGLSGHDSAKSHLKRRPFRFLLRRDTDAQSRHVVRFWPSIFITWWRSQKAAAMIRRTFSHFVLLWGISPSS